jgi:hypothetical protein
MNRTLEDATVRQCRITQRYDDRRSRENGLGQESDRQATWILVKKGAPVEEIQMYTSFDPETLNVLRRALEEAAARLPNDRFTQHRKAMLASRILALASNGETDPTRLRTVALEAEFPF